jgi:hypothetical protein
MEGKRSLEPMLRCVFKVHMTKPVLFGVHTHCLCCVHIQYTWQRKKGNSSTPLPPPMRGKVYAGRNDARKRAIDVAIIICRVSIKRHGNRRNISAKCGQLSLCPTSLPCTFVYCAFFYLYAVHIFFIVCFCENVTAYSFFAVCFFTMAMIYSLPCVSVFRVPTQANQAKRSKAGF